MISMARQSMERELMVAALRSRTFRQHMEGIYPIDEWVTPVYRDALLHTDHIVIRAHAHLEMLERNRKMEEALGDG